MSTLSLQRSKFDQRVVPYIILGYPISQKGFKVLYLDTNKDFSSRDVQFHEKHFPLNYFFSCKSPIFSTFPYDLPDQIPSSPLIPFEESPSSPPSCPSLFMSVHHVYIPSSPTATPDPSPLPRRLCRVNTVSIYLHDTICISIVLIDFTKSYYIHP